MDFTTNAISSSSFPTQMSKDKQTNKQKLAFRVVILTFGRVKVLGQKFRAGELETAFNHSQRDKPSRNSGAVYIAMLFFFFGQNTKYEAPCISLGDFVCLSSLANEISHLC